MMSLEALIDEAREELSQKSEKQIQIETALKWAARACAAMEMGHEEFALDLAHEALEHGALVKDEGATVSEIQKYLELHKIPMSLENSAWSEPIQTGPYGKPKSFSMSGQRGQDRYGKIDNDWLSSSGRTGGDAERCPKCGGSGILDQHQCPECHGRGFLLENAEDLNIKMTPEVESAYESAERSGSKGIENDDGPMVGRFDYPNDKPVSKALNFPRTHKPLLGKKENSSRADWSGIERNSVPERVAPQDVPDDYKASTLFVDMAPYRPTLVRGKEKYGTSVEQNKINDMVSDYQKDLDFQKLNAQGKVMNPGKVDEALWEKAKRASEDAFGKIKYPFVSWWYQKQGGTFG
jgi:hypothetical protein